MHGHLETAGTAATSIAFGGSTDETANSRTGDTLPSSEALELAFDMVGAAIGAFLDALS